MATLFVDGALEEDSWVFVDGEQTVPEEEDVVVTLTLFQEEQEELQNRSSGRLGIYLEAGEQVDEIADHLGILSLVSLDFPTYADGRAFSKARLLWDKYGFIGQIRAYGDVRIDQISHMKRSGFNAFTVNHQPTIDQLIAGKDTGLTLYYQPGAGDVGDRVSGKAWARRAV